MKLTRSTLLTVVASSSAFTSWYLAKPGKKRAPTVRPASFMPAVGYGRPAALPPTKPYWFFPAAPLLPSPSADENDIDRGTSIISDLRSEAPHSIVRA